MDKREEGLREKYTENLLERVGKKIVAKKFNIVEQLDYKVELSEKERLAYEVVLLKVEKKLQKLGFKRYFSEDFDDITKVASELRISRRTYYSQRKELLVEVDKYLTSKGYGYNNASDVDRYGLPDRLSVGRYIKVGRDFVYENSEGDFYDIQGGSEGLEYYGTVRVVKDLEVFNMLTEDESRIQVEVKGVEDVRIVGDYGVGIIVVVDEEDYEEGEGIGYVLNHLEVAVVGELGEEGKELLGMDTILNYKNGRR